MFLSLRLGGTTKETFYLKPFDDNKAEMNRDTVCKTGIHSQSSSFTISVNLLYNLLGVRQTVLLDANFIHVF